MDGSEPQPYCVQSVPQAARGCGRARKAGAVQLAIGLLTASLDSPDLQAQAMEVLIPDPAALGDFWPACKSSPSCCSTSYMRPPGNRQQLSCNGSRARPRSAATHPPSGRAAPRSREPSGQQSATTAAHCARHPPVVKGRHPTGGLAHEQSLPTTRVSKRSGSCGGLAAKAGRRRWVISQLAREARRRA